MKFTYAIAVFLGVAAANEPVWSLRSVNDHKTDSAIQKSYGDHSVNQANARPPYQSAMQRYPYEYMQRANQDYTDETTRAIFKDKTFDNSKDIFGTNKPKEEASLFESSKPSNEKHYKNNGTR